MGLLNKLEKKLQKHPLRDESFEMKINYLNAVAFFMAIDDSVSEQEEKEFIHFIELLECEDAKDDLLDFLHYPQEEEFENIFHALDEKSLLITYLLEIFFMLENGCNKEEERFIDLVINEFGYKKGEKNLLLALVHNAKSNKNVKTIYKSIADSKTLKDNLQQINSFYKLSLENRKLLGKFQECYSVLLEKETQLEGIRSLKKANEMVMKAVMNTGFPWEDLANFSWEELANLADIELKNKKQISADDFIQKIKKQYNIANLIELKEKELIKAIKDEKEAKKIKRKSDYTSVFVTASAMNIFGEKQDESYKKEDILNAVKQDLLNDIDNLGKKCKQI